MRTFWPRWTYRLSLPTLLPSTLCLLPCLHLASHLASEVASLRQWPHAYRSTCWLQMAASYRAALEWEVSACIVILCAGGCLWPSIQCVQHQSWGETHLRDEPGNKFKFVQRDWYVQLQTPNKLLVQKHNPNHVRNRANCSGIRGYALCNFPRLGHYVCTFCIVWFCQTRFCRSLELNIFIDSWPRTGLNLNALH